MKKLSIVVIVRYGNGKYGTFNRTHNLDTSKTEKEIDHQINMWISDFVGSPVLLVPSHAEAVVSISHCIY